ncbi:MAG: hypothetical protein EOO61_11965 [Hymenobacter sp.]|nr:MAG: hypothetical protein EOO61_11965 [Hymenobacter sp.]
MRPWLVLLFSSFLAVACSSEPQQTIKKYSFSYRGEYYPSFMPSCIITIVARDSINRIHLRAYDDHRATPITILDDSVSLSPADLTFFFAKLDSVSVLKLGTSDYPPGLDGITVYNTISQGSTQHKFKFWSPRKHSAPQEHKLVEAVLGLSRRKFTALKEQEYFESLEQYFDFGLPCKITSTDPFEVRIYGSLSLDEEQSLTKFIHQLPADRPILIDMSNFRGMGTIFYPLFRTLLTRNPRIVWVTSKGSRDQLQEMGVPAARMAMSTVDGRALIQQLTSTL